MSYLTNIFLNNKYFVPNHILLFLFSVKLVMYGGGHTYNYIKNNWESIIDFIENIPVPYPSDYFLFPDFDYDPYKENKSEKTQEEKKELKYEEKYLDSFNKCDNFFIFTEEEENDIINKIEELKSNNKKQILDLKNKIEDINSKINLNKPRPGMGPEYETEYYSKYPSLYTDFLQEGYSLMEIDSDLDSIPELIPNDNDSFCPVSPISQQSSIMSLNITDETKEIKDNQENQENQDTIKELNIQKDLIEQELKAIESHDEDYFNELAKEHIINNKKNNLKNSILIEKTPLGNVMMHYDNSDDSFVYYSDNSIPYRFLEVAARRYVVVFKCKPVYIDMKEVLKDVEDKIKTKRENINVDTSANTGADTLTNKSENPKSVFAKFKSYNKNISKTLASIPAKQNNQASQMSVSQTNDVLKDRSNKYVWKGKMMDFGMIKKIDKKINDKRLAMTFTEFKRINKK
jgi:hypothetical protein